MRPDYWLWIILWLVGTAFKAVNISSTKALSQVLQLTELLGTSAQATLVVIVGAIIMMMVVAVIV